MFNLELSSSRGSALDPPALGQWWFPGTSHLLEFPVPERGGAGHDGFDEEGLVSFAFLKASHDAEAPTFQVSFTKDNVLTEVKVAVSKPEKL